MKAYVYCLFIFVLSIPLFGQDYYYLDTNKLLNLPANVYSIDMRDREGDRRDYARTRLPVVGQFPAIVDARTGFYVTSVTNVAMAVSNLYMQARALCPEAISNYVASAKLVNDNGKSDLKSLRKTNKKNKEADAITALAARIEMLEALLKQHGIMTPATALEEQ